MKDKKFSMNMCEGALFPMILSFTIPLILSSVLQLLFNAADMVVAGRFVGSNALAAIGATSSLINLLVNVFLGLSVGSNVLVARFFGSGLEKDVHETVHTSILLALISGLMLTVIGIIFAPKILFLMGTPDDILPLASTYIRIYFAGMPVSMLYNFGAAILRSIGDTKRPLTYLTIAGIVNAITNLIFIVVFKMGVSGVAYATVLSQALSAYLTLNCLAKSEESYRLELKKLRIYRDKLFMILRLGLPAGFQGCMFSISNVIIQSSINSFGADAMAGNTAASNLEGFVYVSMNAVHHTCLSFTSQNYGAHKFDRIKKVLIMCLLLTVFNGVLLGYLSYFFGVPLLSIYSNDSTVIDYGLQRMAVIMLTYFTCGAMDVCVGGIRGLGYSILPMAVTLIGVVGFRFIWIFTVFKYVHTLECLYLSYPLSWTITTFFHIICFIIVYKKLKRNNS